MATTLYVDPPRGFLVSTPVSTAWYGRTIFRADHGCGANDMVTIVQADDPDGIARAQRLFLEYNATIAVDLEFQGFDHELANLPGRYAPPSGRLLLAVRGPEPVGCVALRQIEPGVGELKRLYVRPAFQGRGIGRRLVEQTIVEAREAGYHTLRLDTLPAMERARALYEAIGFYPIPPYTLFTVVPGTTFYELDLNIVAFRP